MRNDNGSEDETDVSVIRNDNGSEDETDFPDIRLILESDVIFVRFVRYDNGLED